MPPEKTPAQLNSTVMEVSPDMAKGWLATQHQNRAIDSRLVASLKRAIEQGQWKVTHQGIAFDKAGLLVDGQHRLTAIAMAGVPVRIMVTFGVTREVAIAAVDQGLKRTLGQLAGMRGETHATNKASICRAIWIAVTGANLGARFDPYDLDAILPEWRTEIEWIIQAGGLGIPNFTSAVVAAMALSLRLPSGDQFVTGLITGAGLNERDPRLALRKQLAGHTLRKRTVVKNMTADRLLRTISCADMFVQEEEADRIEIALSRYKRFCKTAKLPESKVLMTYATGGTV